jgi:hypothetical protein
LAQLTFIAREKHSQGHNGVIGGVVCVREPRIGDCDSAVEDIIKGPDLVYP